MKKNNITKWTMLSPSPFDEDYGKVEPRWITMHFLDPVYDDKGYVVTYGKRIKVVSRDRKTDKIISIKP